MTQASVLDLSQVRGKAAAPAEQKFTMSELRSAAHELKREMRTIIVRRHKAVISLLEAAANPNRLQLPPGAPDPMAMKQSEVQFCDATLNRLRDAVGAAAVLERLEANPELGKGFDEILKTKNKVMGLIISVLKTDIREVKPLDAFAMATIRELGGAIDMLEA